MIHLVVWSLLLYHTSTHLVNSKSAFLPFAKRICEMLMTVGEVAEYLKVRKETVYGWIKDREIAAIYLDRAIRIDEKDLANFVNRHRKDAKR